VIDKNVALSHQIRDEQNKHENLEKARNGVVARPIHCPQACMFLTKEEPLASLLHKWMNIVQHIIECNAWSRA
jgi:hypothetical protein